MSNEKCCYLLTLLNAAGNFQFLSSSFYLSPSLYTPADTFLMCAFGKNRFHVLARIVHIPEGRLISIVNLL